MHGAKVANYCAMKFLRRRNLRLSHLNSLANQALAQLRPAAACRPGCTNHGPPPHPAPPQHPARRHVAAASSAVAPQSQRWASDIALRRPACASPTLSLCALPARTPWARHLNAALRAGGRVAATAPAPSARGAQQQRHHRWLYVHCASPCAPAIRLQWHALPPKFQSITQNVDCNRFWAWTSRWPGSSSRDLFRDRSCFTSYRGDKDKKWT